MQIQSLLAKFAPALLPLAVALIGGIQVMFADNKADPVEGWQFAALAAGAIVTFVVPLLKSGWQAGLKVAMNVLAAVAVVLIDLLNTGTFSWDVATISFVALAALQALGAEIGVGVRLDQAKAVIDSRFDPGVPTITSLDRRAEEVVLAIEGTGGGR